MKEIKISLLPRDLKKKSLVLKKWGLVTLVLVIITVVVIFLNFISSLYVRSNRAELELLEIQNNALEVEIQRLSYIESLRNETQSYERVRNDLQEQKADWVYVIQTIPNHNALYGVRMESMNMNGTAETEQIVIRGTVRDVDRLRDWAARTQSMAIVSQVSLRNFQHSEAGENMNLSFEAYITMTQWRMPEESENE